MIGMEDDPPTLGVNDPISRLLSPRSALLPSPSVVNEEDLQQWEDRVRSARVGNKHTANKKVMNILKTLNGSSTVEG